MEYFGLKLGQDLGNRAAHPCQEFRGVPPSPPGKQKPWLITAVTNNTRLFAFKRDGLKGHCHGVTCAEFQETLSDGVLINKLFFPYISLQVAQVSTSFES